MTRIALAVSVGCSVVLQGCFLFHRLDDDDPEDGGAHSDASGDGALICESLGIYPACGEYCDPGCTEVGPFRCEPPCPDGMGCVYEQSICRWGAISGMSEFGENERTSCSTEFGRDTMFTNACSTAEYVCVTDRTDRFDPFDPMDPGAAGCVHSSYCVASRGLFDGVQCYYPDRTPVVTGPPAEACPDSLSDVFRFCGRECEGCDITGDQLFPPSCLGVNDRRGIGICTDRGCRPGEEVLDPAYALERYGEVTACLLPRHAETREYWEYGWAVGLETCKAYRALYPDDFDCRDIDWTSIPE